MFDFGAPLNKRAVYGWLLTHSLPIKGKRILDFGPGGPMWPEYLRKLGAKVDFIERDEGVARWLESLAMTRVVQPPAGAYDVVLASSAIQHNYEGAEAIYQMLAAALKPDGRMWVAEQMGPATRWWADRQDPMWIRTLAEHHALWASAGFHVEREAHLVYEWNPDPNQGWVRWCEPHEASVVVAILRRAS